MQVNDLGLGGVLEIIPRKHGDQRGFFSETYQRQRFADAGIAIDWVQDNQSYSAEKGVLRGLQPVLSSKDVGAPLLANLAAQILF